MTRPIGISSIKAASYALAKGHEMVGADRADRRVTFLFTRTPALESDLQQFFHGNPTIGVHDIHSATARLKSVIFSADFARGARC